MNPTCLLAIATLTAEHVVDAHARTFHVAPNGDDAHSDEFDAPLRALQRAPHLARAGDTVLLYTGVYRDGVVLRFSGEPDKPIGLRGQLHCRPCSRRRRHRRKRPAARGRGP